LRESRRTSQDGAVVRRAPAVGVSAPQGGRFVAAAPPAPAAAPSRGGDTRGGGVARRRLPAWRRGPVPL